MPVSVVVWLTVMHETGVGLRGRLESFSAYRGQEGD